MVMFFAAISAPISWKKVQFQNNLTWCGWRINFLHETIEIAPEKTIKLQGQLHELLKAGKVKRKLLEQVLGLLIWATSLSPELRSWLAPLYTDLRSPPGCMILSALDAKAVLRSAVHGIFMPPGSKVLEFQGACVRTPSDLPRVVPSHKSAWVRVADASAEHTRLSKLSKQSVEWLLQCFHLDLPATKQANAGMQSSRGCLRRGQYSGHRGLVQRRGNSRKSRNNGHASLKKPNVTSHASKPWLNVSHGPARAKACVAFAGPQGQITQLPRQVLINCSPLLGLYKSLCNL